MSRDELTTAAKRALDVSRRRFNGPTELIHTQSVVIGVGDSHFGGMKKRLIRDQDVIVAFNGVLHNEQELRSRHGWNKTTDDLAGLLASLYRKYGLEFVSMLIGHFSFCLWDHRLKRFVLATDHLGIEPLFYRYEPHGIEIGSTIAQICRSNDAIRTEHLMLVLATHFEGYIPTRRTVRRNIYRVMPGHYVTLSFEGTRVKEHVHRYWDLNALPPANMPRSEYITRLRELIVEAIEKHTQESVALGRPACVTFSGGLDSSTILYTLLRHSPIPPAAVTMISGYTGDDPYFELVNSRPEVQRRWITSDMTHSLQDHWDSVTRTDEPIDPVLTSPRILEGLATAAIDMGSRQILYGSAGDALWQGHKFWIPEVLRSHQWLRAFRGLRDWSRFANRTLFSEVRWAFKHLREWDHHYGYYLRLDKIPYLNPEPFQQYWDELTDELHQLGQPGWPGRQHIHSAILLENGGTGRNDYYFYPRGLQEVSPFFYRPLIEFMITTPAEWNRSMDSTGAYVTKAALREAMHGVLPDMIRQRLTKGGSGDEQYLFLKRGRKLISNLFLDGACRLADLGLLDPKVMEEVVSRWHVGADTQWAENIITVEMWLRQQN